MGWNEGEGLGKDGQGAVTHIKISQRPENLGLGNVEGDLANSGFLTTINGYNDVLQNLASQYACMYWSRTKNAAQAVVSFEFYRWMINSIFFTLASIKKTKKVEKHHHHHHHKKEKKEELCVLRHKYSRFLKNKDVKGYSEEDKNIIFGNVNEGDLTPMSDDMFGMKGLYSPVPEKEKEETLKKHKKDKKKEHKKKSKKHSK